MQTFRSLGGIRISFDIPFAASELHNFVSSGFKRCLSTCVINGADFLWSNSPSISSRAAAAVAVAAAAAAVAVATAAVAVAGID